MKKSAFLAMTFACVFFSVLALLNYFSSAEIQTNQDLPNIENTSLNIMPSQSFNQPISKARIEQTLIESDDIAVIAYQNFIASPPRYLQGTEIRGAFYLDSQKELIITSSIKQRFDYFFLMTEHIPLEEIINIIHGHLQSELVNPALTQSKILLEKYVSYFKHYNNLMKNHAPKDNHNVYDLAEKVTDLRTHILGTEVADIFFGQAQALQAQNLNRIALESNDPNLISVSDLSEKLQKNQQATLSYTTSKEALITAREAGANEQELNTLRTQLYGEGAALRLKKLYAKRALWHKHLLNYQALNQQLKQTGLSNKQIYLQLKTTFSENHGLTDAQIKQLAAQAPIASINNQ